MTGLQLARLLAMLGAETVVGTPDAELPFEEHGPAVKRDSWRELGRLMVAHEDSDDVLLDRLCRRYGLSMPEYWLVMLVLAGERYPEVAVALGILNEDVEASLVTPMSYAQLMFGAQGLPLQTGLVTALGGGTPCRRGLLELVESLPGRPQSRQILRMVAAELNTLLDPIAPSAPRGEVATGEDAVPAFAAPLLETALRLLQQCPVLCLTGPSIRALKQCALDIAQRMGQAPCFLAADHGGVSVAAIVRADKAMPIVDATHLATLSGTLLATLREAAKLVPHTIVLAPDRLEESQFPVLTIPRLSTTEATRIWESVTADMGLAARLGKRFRLNSMEAKAAWQSAHLLEQAGGMRRSIEEVLTERILEDGGLRIGRMVTHLKSPASIDALVVPGRLREQILEIIQWYRHSDLVFGEMGMGHQTELGRGLICLFAGPPGTGKTFAVQCISNALGLNHYRIDMSQVASKYIGDTEKAFATCFDEAEAGHGLLHFDEADAFFGQRSEVKDAHDRYANLEVSYLLQRLEAFDGVAILTTNLRNNIDPAFTRRMRFLLDFPMPEQEERHALWKQSLPGPAFCEEGLDLSEYARRFRLSGGSIRNIGLAAAHRAAGTMDRRITQVHLAGATQAELEKCGQTVGRLTFGPLARYLPEAR